MPEVQPVTTPVTPAVTEGPAPSTQTTGATPEPAVTSPEPAPGTVSPAGTPEKEGPEPQKGKAVEELIRVRKRAQNAEAEAQRLREELAYAKGLSEGRVAPGATTPVTTTEQPPKKPQENDFASYPEFETAKEQWLIDMGDFQARKRIKEEAEASQRRQTEENARRDRETRQVAFANKIRTERQNDPDFDEIVRDNTFPVSFSTPTLEAISTAEDPIAVIRYLYANKGEAQRLVTLPPVAILKSVGRIEERLAAKSVERKIVTQAPPPISTLSGTSGTPTEVDLSKIPIGDYMARKNREQFSRRK
jgi:hypothetical protein